MGEDKEKVSVVLARHLLNQIENENQHCAFWIISAVTKIKYANPKMSMTCLLNILRQEMPDAAEAYAKYKRET